MAAPDLGMTSRTPIPCEVDSRGREGQGSWIRTWGTPDLLCRVTNPLARVRIWRPRPGSAVRDRHLVAERGISAEIRTPPLRLANTHLVL